MRLWWLMLVHYSYLPIPRRWQAELRELPRALWLLPFWGLLAGALSLLCARFCWLISWRWTAALLLGLQVFFTGGVWLRDLLLVADGRRPPLAQQGAELKSASAKPPLPPQPQFYLHGWAAVIVGCFYLLLYYGCLYLVLQQRLSLFALPALAVASRWVYLWGVYDFAALAPGFLKRGSTRAGFLAASALSLALYALCAFFAPALWPALVVSLLAALLLYRSRLRGLGALDEACYGAAAAWAEVVLLLAYVGFAMI